jgi:hypothetical protein
MPAPTKEIKEVEEAIDLISTGLLLLDQNQEALERLGGTKAVDIAARLNTQYNALSKLTQPLKDKLKAQALEQQTDTLRGESYEASIKKIVKTVLDTEKIKKFFARRLPQYQKEREEITISFDVKT